MNSKLAPVATLVMAACLTGCSTFSKQDLSGMFQRQTPDFDAQFIQARELERNGEIARAKQAYQEILSQNPTMTGAVHRLGVIAAKQGNAEEALAHLSRAQSLDPDNSEILTDIGYVLYTQNRGNEAANALRAALERSPDNERAINNLGLVLGKQGNMAEAHAMFRNIGTEAEALASLGYVYAQRGELEKAEQSFSRALDHDSELRIAAEGLLQINERKRLRGSKPITEDLSNQVAEGATGQEWNGMSDTELAELAQRLNTTMEQRRSEGTVQPASHQANVPAPAADPAPSAPQYFRNQPRPVFGSPTAKSWRLPLRSESDFGI